MYGKLFLVASLFFILIFPQIISSLSISEVMHNPSGSDSGREWIELYNNDTETYNLTGWKLRTDDTDHTLNVPPTYGGQGNMTLDPDNYVVIVQNAAMFLAEHENYSGTVIDSSWPDLSNSVDESVTIKNSTAVFDEINYSAVHEGNTSCRINESFAACEPTPGTSNVAAASNATNQTQNTDIIISILLENATVNVSYSVFQIDITNKTCGALDNITISYNVTPDGSNNNATAEVDCSAQIINWTPMSSGNYTVCGHVYPSLNESNTTNNDICKSVTIFDVVPMTCDSFVTIISGSTINVDSALDYNILLNDTNCSQPPHNVTIEYWIEDPLGGYAKEKLNTSQTFVCSRTIGRQWTPQNVNGDKNYKIIAKIISAGCDDTNTSNDYNETTVMVHGSTTAADQATSTTTTPLGGSSVPVEKNEIVSYPSSVFIDEPFYVIVKIFNPSEGTLFSVYSYVYKGNTPVSLGFNGAAWKGSWDANKIETMVNANSASLVKLLNKVENGTNPGIYNLRVRIKGNGEEEITKSINVTVRPELKIKNYNNSLNVSTSCTGCEIHVVGPGIDEFSNNSYFVPNASGLFYIYLVKGSAVISNYSINISPQVNRAPNATPNKPVGITGFAVNKKFDMKYILLLQLLAKILPIAR